jgi:hypothetical protein
VDDRELTAEEHALVERARRTAFVLYEGREVPHRSCGIALAETFGLPSRPYQALRRGGLTGEGECGAIKAGELILGEVLGDPDPAGPVTAPLRAAIVWYGRELRDRLVARGLLADRRDIICNNLTRPRGEFAGEERRVFCTNLAAEVGAAVAEAILRHGGSVEVKPIP